MISRSESRPAIWAVLLQVARRKVRARAWIGNREVGGVGGGVVSVNCAISVVGVSVTEWTLEVDACLRGAGKNASKRVILAVYN